MLTVAVESSVSKVVRIPTQLISRVPRVLVQTGLRHNTHASTLCSILFTLASVDLQLLPNSYLTSSRLSLDQQAIDNYFYQTTSDPLLPSDDGFGLIQDLQTKEEDLYSATLPKQVTPYYTSIKNN